MTLFIGIDPGLNRTGWGVIEADGVNSCYIDSGTVITSPKQALPERLHSIATQIGTIIAGYQVASCNVLVAIEKTYINNNPVSSLKLEQVRGALTLAIMNCGITPVEYAPKVIKKAITGSGNADKEQIIRMLHYRLPGVIITSKDAADALAIALCLSNYHTSLY